MYSRKSSRGRGKKTRKQQRGGEISFSNAVFYGNIEKVKEYLEKDPSLVEKPFYNTLPLEEAIRGCQKDVIDLLIKKGASVNKQDENGQSALMHAVLHYYPYGGCGARMLDVILGYNPKMDLKDNKGRSALYIAAGKNVVSLVVRLLAAGAKVDNKIKEDQAKFSKEMQMELNLLPRPVSIPIKEMNKDIFQPETFSICQDPIAFNDTPHGDKTVFFIKGSDTAYCLDESSLKRYKDEFSQRKCTRTPTVWKFKIGPEFLLEKNYFDAIKAGKQYLLEPTDRDVKCRDTNHPEKLYKISEIRWKERSRSASKSRSRRG